MKPRRRILAADLFCGAGGTSTGLALACQDLGVDVDLVALNHWDRAIETHEQNHPGARHICKSLHEVDPRKVVPGGYLDILVASPECFPAGTLILTATGLRPIEDVRVGQSVLTHQGRWRPVVRVQHRDADGLVRVSGQGHTPGILTTANHRFYVRPSEERWHNELRRYRRDKDPADWTPAVELGGGESYWSTPIDLEPLAAPAVPDAFGKDPENAWWIIGRWLGDGSLSFGRNQEVVISCGYDELDELTEALDRSGAAWRCYRKRTALNFTLWNKEARDWLDTHFGHGAAGKELPAWALTLPADHRRALLDGYVSADGHIGQRRVMVETVSRKLALGARLLAEGLGCRAGLYLRDQHATVVEGRVVNVLPVWRVAWERTPTAREAFTERGHAWARIRQVTPTPGPACVFNLEVEEDHSYVAEGIVVANCTHHSIARGGRPVNDQMRMSAWQVVDWLAALYVQTVLIENVREFRDWGPVGRNGKPIKSQKGETYQAFLAAIRSLGYRLEERIVNAADHGDPTTRERLFIVGRRGRRPIHWPAPSHFPSELLGPKWRSAREAVVDWSLKGESIFNRTRPLSPNTMARIYAGLRKFGGVEFVVPVNHGKKKGMGRERTVDRPLPTLTAKRNQYLVEPLLVRLNGTTPDAIRRSAKPVSEPAPTVVASGRHLGVVEPFLIGAGGPQRAGQPESLDKPVGTVLTRNHRGLVEPFVVPFFGEAPGQKPRTHSVDGPLPAVTSHGAGGVVEPFVLPLLGIGRGNAPRRIDRPVPTITSRGGGHVVEPMIVQVAHGSGGGRGNGSRVRSAMAPLFTLTANGTSMVFLLKYNRTGGARSVDAPVDTLTAKARYALVEIQGEQYLLDVRFRMLQIHELARAMGFPEGYKFAGTREQQVRQIGNAVAVNTAKALCRSILTE